MIGVFQSREFVMDISLIDEELQKVNSLMEGMEYVDTDFVMKRRGTAKKASITSNTHFIFISNTAPTKMVTRTMS